MAEDLSHQLKLALDDLYCAPLDDQFRNRARHLLQKTPGGSEVETPATHARRIRIACDDLHADPLDTDAQFILMRLLQAKPPSASEANH